MMDFGALSSERQALTNAQLAAILPAMTIRSINPLAARQYFRESGLWVRDFATGAMSGKLQDAVLAANTPAEVKAGLNNLGTAIYDDAAKAVRTDDDVIGVQLFAAVTALVGLGHITQEDGDGFYDLAGGRPWKDETEASIGAARTAYTNEQARVQDLEALRAEIENDHINPAIAGDSDAATIRAAIKAGL